jgi:hypothetical protein
VSDFANADTATLRTIRDNLHIGLDRVAATIDAGTFHTVGPKGAAPPAQSGHLTLALLAGVNAELDRRASCASP